MMVKKRHKTDIGDIDIIELLRNSELTGQTCTKCNEMSVAVIEGKTIACLNPYCKYFNVRWVLDDLTIIREDEDEVVVSLKQKSVR